MENLLILFECRAELRRSLRTLVLLILRHQKVIDVFAYELREAKLNEVRGFLAHLSMAIAHAEIVSEVASVEVWAQNEAVLVHFVRVVRNEADTCSEGILGDDVPFDQLRLDLLTFTLDARHHLDDLPLKFGRRGRC